MDEQLSKIISDNNHGSRYIAVQLLKYLSNNVIEDTSYDQICNKYPDMQLIVELISKIKNSDKPKTTASNLLTSLVGSISSIATKFNQFVNNNDFQVVLTFSHSQTVAEVLSKTDLKIYCMVSNPGNEGKILAENVDGVLIEDAEGIEMIENRSVHCILLGCDKYSKDQFVNKIGTSDIVSVSNVQQIPVVILTSQFKYVESISRVKSNMFESVDFDKNIILITED